MKIIEHNWAWRHGLSRRSVTDTIVLHHAAIKTASAEDIHRAHLQRDNGTWAGIGYHLYIRKDGSIHRGRPLWASGAHVLNENWHTVGVCVEGNYDVETTMPASQDTMCALAFFNADARGNSTTSQYWHQGIGTFSNLVFTYGDIVTITSTRSDTVYIRISAKCSDTSAVVVTRNQEIE